MFLLPNNTDTVDTLARAPFKQHVGTFTRMVEVGRVVLLNDTRYNGRLAVILDVVDHNRALVEGPVTGVPRHSHAYKHMTLTPFKIKNLPRAARASTVRKALQTQEIISKWETTGWAKKIQSRTTRASLSDFDRFKLMKLRKQKRTIISAQVAKLRKEKN
ncbi:ribosomal protein L14-domain-containing protein [Piptocephalis cylindrospora]|uniref:Ribosomal protein L14-domain-containing protein n=1 Tax=Piptocephalis cylindrospora TaxID=1907219 RepID=A0A4P9Y7G3_9FUNG|nr:ribosomal protein L14-domain-containing protein [Piptocephalis cylindrospora]|eukprot:RKP14674.1 ribosomal protein L14-domain-containing protein [Piptocephalis cylindrospora]